VDFEKIGEAAFNSPENEDAELTELGRSQCRAAVAPEGVEIVLVSPLTRTLETATLMFPNKRLIALEAVRELNPHHLCNARRPKSELEKRFPNVDFGYISEEKDEWIGKGDALNRPQQLLDFLASLPAERVAVVSHFMFILAFFAHVGSEAASAATCTNCSIHEWTLN